MGIPRRRRRWIATEWIKREGKLCSVPNKAKKFMGREVDHRLPESLSPSGSVVYSSKSQFPDNFIFLISGFCLPTTRSTRLMAVQYMLYPCALCMTWLSIFTCSLHFLMAHPNMGHAHVLTIQFQGPSLLKMSYRSSWRGIHPIFPSHSFHNATRLPCWVLPRKQDFNFKIIQSSTILDTSTIIWVFHNQNGLIISITWYIHNHFSLALHSCIIAIFHNHWEFNLWTSTNW